MKSINVNEKQNVTYCIPLPLRDEQIKINISKVAGRIMPSAELIKEPIAIVCFAPSLNETWEQIKGFKYVMTCSGAHKFLVERGIIPTHHIDLDPRLHKLKLIGTPQKETEYLIASTIHPQYIDALEGFNVKLWHIFANEDDGARVLPRGEWSITGGSSVGLRCLTIARFLGFNNMHIFGMDGSFTKEKTHSSEHPNPPKESYETEFEGRKFLTTPSMLHVAQETFHELDQMPDCKFQFYGDGLVQAMAKNYKPAIRQKAAIAFNKPELISKEYIELNQKLHRDNPTYGMGGSKHATAILELSKVNKTTSILDYGCGKGQLAKSLPFPIWEYDPAVPDKSWFPKPADIVVCTDVLEHIEPDKLKFVLDDLKFLIKSVGYFVVSTRKAIKTYANGVNTHLIVKGKEWWEKQLLKYFEIGTIIEKKDELHIVVGPKKIIQPDITVVEKDGVKVQFLTPNETTKWRANSLFTKEPATIDWINQMMPGEVMFDVGANIGSYCVLAGIKGVKVYAFEPEAENYSLLIKNMALNNIEPNAYCVALSDEERAGILFAGQQEAGGACHSFNQMVGHDLNPRAANHTQGCFGIPLDTLIERGLPHPQHIKIDVDGLEFKVIKGAEKALMNGLKSILVEVNNELPQHREMVSYLQNIGFEYSQAQVDKAARKNGTFKGVAEYVFIKVNNTIANKVIVTTIKPEPFPHIYIDEFFTNEMYADILKNMPTDFVEIEKTRGTRGYPKRFTATPKTEFWKNVYKQLTDRRFKQALCDKFGIENKGLSEDILLVRDEPGYQISPHTDSTSKVITVLIYLPEDNSNEGEGTSLFMPKQEGFICKMGKHYEFKDFNKVKTMPYRPNCAFAFARTDNSFHGVELCSHVRNVLLYNIKR